MCKAARSAKARKSACDEQNKETIKRERVRDVTTPRAFHKLLGNFWQLLVLRATGYAAKDVIFIVIILLR